MSQSATEGFTPKKRIIKPLPPVEFLRECFEYDPETGILTWKERPLSHFPSEGQWKTWNTQYAGKHAGMFRRDRSGEKMRSTIGFWGKGVFAIARIAMALCGRDVPEGWLVDHFNGDKWDNRLENLRPVTHQKNLCNLDVPRNKASGLPLGVAHWDDGRFQAYITFQKKRYPLGLHRTLEEAVAARKAGELKYFGENSRAHRG